MYSWPLKNTDLLEPCRSTYMWIFSINTIQFSSVTQPCPTLCDPLNRNMPGFPVHHQLPELTQIMPIELMMPSNRLIICRPFSWLQSCPTSRSFPLSQFFTLGVHSIGVSTSASVLPMNIQDWFPLGWTGWISLQSKGLSRVFSNTTVQKHQFFGIQFPL